MATEPDVDGGDGEDGVAEPVGPLQGGYRPSSLRLIDEAVAAAQAIEPGLFEDDAPDRAPSAEGADGNGVAGTDGGVDGAGSAESGPAGAPGTASTEDRSPAGEAGRNGVASAGTWEPAVAPADAGEVPPEAAAPLRAVDREESGLRMIGSLGRDRAEASGELAPLGRSRPLRSETARELVTILPRRATRELPAVPPPLTDALPTPTPTSSMLTPRTAPAREPSASNNGALRIAPPGSGVHARRAGRWLDLVRSLQHSGPGLGAILLIALALVLAGTAVVLRLRRHTHSVAPVRSALPYDGPGLVATPGGRPPTAALGVAAGDAAAVPRSASAGRSSTMPEDAPGGMAPAVAGSGARFGESVRGWPGPEVPRDEATVGAGHHDGAADAPAAPAGAPGGGGRGPMRPDRMAEAKALYDQASDAVEGGDFPRALELVNASLKQRRTARSYVLRARAEQRLGRVDAALRSLDAATEIAPTFAAIWEQRGRILWAARRRDEARVAFARFLELAPSGPAAAEVQRLMDEP